MFKNSNNTQKVILTAWMVTSFIINIIWLVAISFGNSSINSFQEFVGFEGFLILTPLIILGMPTLFIYKLWADKK